MRPCPYCGKDIQDEAIVCRYCGLDVERPEWLRNKIRCPYCAEWISPGQDLCPFCKSELQEEIEEPAQETEEEAPAAPPFSDELSELRASVTDEEAADEEPDPAEEPLPEPELEPEPVANFRTAPPEESAAQEPYLDSGWMNGAQDEPLRARPVQESRFNIDLSVPDWVRGEAAARVLRVGLVGLLVIGIVAGGAYLVREFRDELPSVSLLLPTATPTPSPTRAPAPSPSPTATAENSSGSPTPRGCLSWEQITLDDAGEELCVYGTVRRWFAAGDLPFVAIFSEEAGTFALVDRSQAHPEVSPGQCIRGEGVVEIMSATRPFIDLDGEVLECPPEG